MAKKTTDSLRVAVCAISKWEDQYLVEWVEYYKSIGFTNVLFYDNNIEGDDGQYNILKPYIDDGFVIYHDFRTFQNCCQQRLCYVECMKAYKNSFDWIAYFDIDEFIDIGEYKTISAFLKSNKNFQEYDNIAIRWVIMDDNDLVHNDGRPCLERFTVKREDAQPNVKSIANTKKITIESISNKFNPHVLNVHNNICNIYGKKYNKEVDRNEINAPVYIKHFRFKTVEELLDKIKRGDVYTIGFDRAKLLIAWFFGYNKKTKEKEDIINNFLKTYKF